MHLPKVWKDVGSVKDAFIPKRRGKDRQRRERRPKTKKAKKHEWTKKKEKKATKTKKTKAYPQAANTGKGWQFSQCLPFRSFGILPENLAQPRPGQIPSSPGRVDEGDSAASVRPTSEVHVASGSPCSSKSSPSTSRSYTKAATWSSTLSSAGSSLSFAASKIKETLLRRRHTDLSQSVSSPHSESGEQPQRYIPMPPTSPDLTKEEKPAPRSSWERAPMIGQFDSAAPTTEIRTRISKSASNLEVLREKLKKRAATSNEFNEIWESEGLPHLRKTLNDNYNGDYSVTIQFNYTSSKRVVEVMTSGNLSEDVHQKVKRNVLPCFENAPHLMVEVHFRIGTVSHNADVARPSHDSEDNWGNPKNQSKYSIPVCGDSVGVEGGNSAATLGPAVKLGNKRGWLVNWHIFEGIQNWKTLDVDSGVPDHYLVHPAPIDCPKNESPKRIAKLHVYSGLMYQTCRQSVSLRLFGTPILPEEETTMNVVTDWAFCIANEDEWLQNRLRYAPPGIEFDEVSDPIRERFTGKPQLQIVGTTGRSSGFRYAVVCETPAETRLTSLKPTREWYLEQVDVGPTFDWVCEGPGMPGDSGAAVVHEETQCIIGQIWGRNRYAGSETHQRITYFTHIEDIFDDIKEICPSERPLRLILGEDGRPSDTSLHNETLTPNVPRSTSTLDTLVRSTIGDGDNKHVTDKPTMEGPAYGMDSSMDALRRSAAKVSFEDDGIMMRRRSTMVAT